MTRCRFAKICKHYVKSAPTCENDLEAVEGRYCGLARRFKEIKFVDMRDLR